ncbi:MAG: hypothetical protein ACP5SQ_07160 [Candidatus Saccharicenans sp.]
MAPARKKAAPKPILKKGIAETKGVLNGFECEICGYRLIVDKECGCGEEHIILCCGRPMKKVNIKT